jgi:hypothetical protein
VPVSESDIVVYLSATGSSDGGAISATALATGVKNGLWPDISDVSRAAGGTRTKKWYLANENGTDSLIAPGIFLAGEPTGLTEEIGLGVDSADDSDPAQGNMTAWASAAVVALVSSGVDTRQATIYGLDGAGDPVAEIVTLNGTTEVLSVGTFTVVWAVHAASVDAGRTVTVKQGSGGTTRGTIGPSKRACWLWVHALNSGTAMILPDLPASSHYGIWDRQTWAAGIAAQRPAYERVAVEETA